MSDTKPGSSGDRRRTVSGPLPNIDAAGDDGEMKPASLKLAWAPPSNPPSPTVAPPAAPSPKRSEHRRSISGNLLSKFNFLNRHGDDDKDNELKPPKSPKSSKSRKSIDDDEPTTSPVSPVKGDGAMAAALKATKQRKRKGSLRKTALLGTRRLVTETRERRNSVLQRTPSTKQVQQGQAAQPSGPGSESQPQPVRARVEPSNESALHYTSEESKATHDDENGWGESAAAASTRLTLLTMDPLRQDQRITPVQLKSPLDIKSPTSNGSYTSTTDDEDMLTFDQPAASYAKPHAAYNSYFPETSLSRRPSHQIRKHSRSPLSQNLTSTLSTFAASPLAPEPHDYTETEYWGWVILIVTWLIFTVGMGSCLEIWSWAWDVGETPYAPPELEDDPTLPIVGYYPALIVLTGVVAWIWITVAWMGMKYFRHAKIEV